MVYEHELVMEPKTMIDCGLRAVSLTSNEITGVDYKPELSPIPQ
jgi:hypothetical protein